MLFAFGRPRLVTMWMKNTPLPLDMVFLNPDGTVAHIAERTTPYSEDIVSSGGNVAFALELNAGVSRLIGLKVGDRVEHRLFTNSSRATSGGASRFIRRSDLAADPGCV